MLYKVSTHVLLSLIENPPTYEYMKRKLFVTRLKVISTYNLIWCHYF